MKKGIIFGAFDLLHPGHVYTLKECRKLCEWLIVGLHVDPSNERKTKNKPAESVFGRYIRLSGCRYVDQIIPYETSQDLVDMLEMVDVDVRFVGGDYLDHPERMVGGDIVPVKYVSREHNYSSSILRKSL